MANGRVAGLKLLSSIDGRERWLVPGLYGNDNVAAEVEHYFETIAGIDHVKANPLTGRVLVCFDPGIAQKGINAFLENCLSILGLIPKDSLKSNESTAHATGQSQDGPKNKLFNLISGVFGENSKALFDLIHSAKPEGSSLGQATSLSTAGTLLKVAGPINLGLIIVAGVIGGLPLAGVPILCNIAVLANPLVQMTLLTALYFSLSSLQSVVEYKRKNAWENYATEIYDNLRRSSVAHIHNMDMASLDNMSSHELVSRVNNDGELIAQFINTVPHSFIERGLTLFIGTSVLFIVAPTAFIIAVAPIPVLYYITKSRRQTITESFQLKLQSDNRLKGVVSDNINGIATIRSFTAEEQEIKRLEDISVKHIKDNKNATEMANWITSVTQFALSSGIAASMIYGSTAVLNGSLPFPALSLLSSLLPPMIMSTQGIAREVEIYQAAVSAAEHIIALRGIEPTIVSGPIKIENTALKKGITFHRVDFAYANGTPLIHSLDLYIAAGKTTAFVGDTGSGKTTLVKLLGRFYDIQGGNIEIDGNCIKDIELKHLRRLMSVISQDPFLFQSSIIDNIRYGRPQASDEDVIQAAKHAQAYDFIQAMPKQFNTVLDECGKTLSGGQRQRLSIARAILKDAPVLVLDEATSSVDNKTEDNFKSSLAEISRNKTTIIIAHRLSTVKNADKIYLISNGTVKEEGTHDELVEHEGHYAELWNLQTQKKAS
ncbi:MAG: ABC transporter ATP-binding protein [Gammaproteobacteria bacterium]|nr:ABC transporter ATP-binding protein [Gammaproteobacteria bacterium]